MNMETTIWGLGGLGLRDMARHVHTIERHDCPAFTCFIELAMQYTKP